MSKHNSGKLKLFIITLVGQAIVDVVKAIYDGSADNRHRRTNSDLNFFHESIGFDDLLTNYYV